MTDRELLELAARAGGVNLKYDTFGNSEDAERIYCYWNPLTDDGDALRLAVAVPTIDVSRFILEAWQAYPTQDGRMAYVRRAITRAAAEIGKGVV